MDNMNTYYMGNPEIIMKIQFSFKGLRTLLHSYNVNKHNWFLDSFPIVNADGDVIAHFDPMLDEYNNLSSEEWEEQFSGFPFDKKKFPDKEKIVVVFRSYEDKELELVSWLSKNVHRFAG